MSELRSKCCGAKVRFVPNNKYKGFRWVSYCSKCSKPCEVKEKEGGGEEVKKKEQFEDISTKYQTIVIDPPWQVKKIRRKVRPNQKKWIILQ